MLCQPISNQIHRNYHQYRFMKKGGKNNPCHKHTILFAKNILHGVHSYSQYKIIPYGIKTGIIISTRHKQKYCSSKPLCLIIHGLHKKEHCNNGKKSKHRQIFIISENTLDNPYHQIKPRLVRYMSVLHNQIKLKAIYPVIITHCNSAS